MVGSGEASCRTILLVEDDEDIRETLSDILRYSGYEVVGARNGRAALEQLAAMQPPCLILLDLMMPVMSGPEFLTILRADQAAAEIPVVILSAYLNMATRIEAQGFLKKPVVLPELFAFLQRYCPGAANPGAPAS